MRVTIFLSKTAGTRMSSLPLSASRSGKVPPRKSPSHYRIAVYMRKMTLTKVTRRDLKLSTKK